MLDERDLSHTNDDDPLESRVDLAAQDQRTLVRLLPSLLDTNLPFPFDSRRLEPTNE